MQYVSIEGGNPLYGRINIEGSKNAALPIMAASILSSEDLILHNVPRLVDIRTMIELLRSHGARVDVGGFLDSCTLKINCSKIDNFKADYSIVSRMRASIWVLGPLVSRFGIAEVSLPGGCALGARQVDLHIALLEAMGATVFVKNGYINASLPSGQKLRGVHFCFNKVSVGATITAIMAASIAQGVSLLVNCAQEPEIVDLCNCLNKMGAKISGIGTAEIEIVGVPVLGGAEYRVIPDRIEAGTYMIAAAITGGEVEICGIEYRAVENLGLKLIEAGINISSDASSIYVKRNSQIKAVDIQTQPYPGFSTDLQAQFMALMTLSDGVSIVTENIFENRLMHVPELNRMGASISIGGNHTAVVRGVKSLQGAKVMASDLRASVSLIIAGLAAQGTTELSRVYHLDRGYHRIEEKLRSCGARIERVGVL
jgi:UDP-N-acetylglucosamine 1-carboxyvinyltransferase